MKKKEKDRTGAGYSIIPVINPQLSESLSALPNLSDTIMIDMIKKLSTEWDTKLKTYIQDNLKKFGHTFETEIKFFDFCKIRVYRLAFTDNPHYFEFYLDFIDPNNRGTFIGSCSEKIDFKIEGNTATVMIGKDLS